MLGRATRWDQQAAERLGAERAAIIGRIEALPDEREAAREESRLKEAANRARMRPLMGVT